MNNTIRDKHPRQIIGMQNEPILCDFNSFEVIQITDEDDTILFLLHNRGRVITIQQKILLPFSFWFGDQRLLNKQHQTAMFSEFAAKGKRMQFDAELPANGLFYIRYKFVQTGIKLSPEAELYWKSKEASLIEEFEKDGANPA